MSSTPEKANGKPVEATECLRRMARGDGAASREFWELVYGELHRLAERQMQRLGPAETLQPTALVHEAWLRLFDHDQHAWSDREHFLAFASRAMRSALVDAARRRHAEKRGGARQREAFQVVSYIYEEERGVDLVALDEALSRLGETEPRQASVIELRFFGGLTLNEAALALSVSKATVERDWHVARIFLREELRPR